MPIESGLLEILACPACHAPLKEQSPAPEQNAADRSTADQSAGQENTVQESELLCTGKDCGLIYPIRDGIPVLLVDEARRPA
ncbi:Trm112 family protein [Streptomyces odontomachi]|uniref:Trm112 family protein n=1 Tax=Streptomyces odontomachi TaxID=2944940 RepID=UPI00210BDA02|nr:Trm112 family protein [Streptomyces sp. ODS25]